MKVFRFKAAGLFCMAAFVATGCGSSSQMAELEERVRMSETRAANLETQLQEVSLEARRLRAEAEAREAEQQDFSVQNVEGAIEFAPVVDGAAAAMAAFLPPNAEPGMCYARLHIPEQTRSYTEQILTQEAGDRIETEAAQYEWVTERVMVKEAGEEIVEVKPAVYEWVEERIMSKPASFRLEEIPARYETVTERIRTRPARTVWKPTEGRIYGTALVEGATDNLVRDASGRFLTKLDTRSGQLLCLVEEPAEYQEITRRVLVSEASTRRVEIPAEYETVRRQEMVRPPQVVKREVPAQYEDRRVRRLVAEASQRRVSTPAQYESVTRTEITDDERFEWLPVLCEINFTTNTVRRLQASLKQSGHYTGNVDGVYGRLTHEAVTSYQRANGLSTGGLTLQALDHMGLSYPGPRAD